MIKDEYRGYLYVFYAVIAIIGVYDCFVYLFRHHSFIKSYEAFLTYGFSTINYVIIVITFLLFLASIFNMYLYHRKRISFSALLCSIYYVFYYLVWGFIIPLIVGAYNKFILHSDEMALIAINNLSTFDIVFFVVSIILPLYCIIKLKK